MVIWGAIWGAVFGALWPGYGGEFHALLGTVLGAGAGWTLRNAVRKEVAAQRVLLEKAIAAAAPRTQTPAPSAAPQPHGQPAAVEPPREVFADTSPLPEPILAMRTQTPPPPTPAARTHRPAAQPDLVTSLVTRARDWLFGGNTVVRMGVLVLFVGLAFLARYAVDNALLPPEMRLAAIAAAGIALFVFGLRLHRRRPDQEGYATTLQGAGIAVLYLTVFAAFRLYQFLPPAAAFAALALVCLFSTIIALAQDAPALAFIGFAGAYAAPVLVSTGQGSHVGLFSYYLLLGVAIAAIAWLRAWRPLNLLGFFATFGVATAWGVLRYKPEQFASTEPFLLAFFATWLLASLFYALRHGQGARQAIDGTLVFGTPIVAFGLQAGLVRDMPYASAFSALALGAVYVVLGSWLVKRNDGDAKVNRWLAECFAALALGFITLAVPLALDGHWTSAVWAVEGAGVYWMGRRQGRWLARLAGLVLQVMAAGLFLDHLGSASQGRLPVANAAFLGAAMLAGAALALAWWSREPLAAETDSATGRGFASFEAGLSPWLFWVGFAWWQSALGSEIGRMNVETNGGVTYVFDASQRMLLTMVGWVASAFVLHHLALPRRAQPWPMAATPAWLVLPVMLLGAPWGMATLDHVFQSGGWLAWPLVIVLHAVMLRRLDAGPPRAWWPWVHAGGVWLLVLLAGNLLAFAIGRAELWQTAWATVILLVAGSIVLLALARRRWFEGAPGELRWPLDRFAAAYLWRAAAPLAVALAAGALVVAVHSSGEARPLPYVPLLNPTDLAVALAIAACALWLVRLRTGRIPVPAVMETRAVPGALAAIAFIAINTVWLRVAHHFAGVPWDANLLFASFVVQAGYSILWTLIALALMVGAHRRHARTPWMLGAGLLGLTVLKLFVIDLSNRNGSERIVVFIAVGLLMLVVGWFAPLPPARAAKPADGELQGAAS
jgi:uncharacterized membrane protein